MSFSEWKSGILDDLADIVMGQSPLGATCNDDGIGTPLLNGPTEFGSSHPTAVQYTSDPKKVSDIGDLLFCVRGSTTGKMNWADSKYAIGRGLAAFRHKKGILFQPFLRGVIEYNLSSLLAEATGSTFPNVSSQQLKALKVKIPPLKIQQKISSILSSLDDKIELNRQTNQTLEAIAQALFQEMCVPKGDELPEGWRVGKLGDVIETVSETYKFGNKEKIIFLNTGDILNGLFLHSNYSVVDGLPGQAKKRIHRNDILFSEIRPVNRRFAFVDFEAEEYVVSTKLMVLRTKRLNPIFLYFYLTRQEMISNLQHLAETRSGTFPQITFSQLEDLKIILPPTEILEEFIRILESNFSLQKNTEKETQTLITLRDSLLPKLMKGEIEI